MEKKIQTESWLYRRRSNVLVWLSFVGFGFALGMPTVAAIHFVSTCLKTQWLNSPGPWTLVILVVSAPTAWLVWYVRDQNHARALANEERAHTQQKFEHDWEVFQKLAEWACKPRTPDALKSVAILHSRIFITGEPNEPTTWRDLVRSNRLAWPGQLMLKALLTTRGWPTYGPHVDFAIRSPVEQAITTALRELDRNEMITGLNFAGWNLSSLWLAGVKWRNVKLRSANLQHCRLSEADLSDGNLESANLESANLEKSNLSGARLGGANFKNADLTGADLSNASLKLFDDVELAGYNTNFEGAILAGANLRGVDLEDISLARCYVSGTQIDGKWEKLIAGIEGIEGVPMYVE